MIGGPPTNPGPTPSATTSPSDGGVIIGHTHPAPNGAGGITDKELRDLTNATFARLDPGEGADAVSRQRGYVIVGKWLAKFVSPPAKIYALSQEQRVAFVEGLAALT